ncbi:hypothetical protein C0389_01495 [bacterium]|nr:hypothetical protein [bacterium]
MIHNFRYIPFHLVTNKSDDEAGIIEFKLEQNYPNPFNPETAISYQIPIDSKVILKIFDVLGRKIETLVNEDQSDGWHKVKFDGTKLSSGVYYYQLSAGSFMKTKKFVLTK